MLIQRESQL